MPGARWADPEQIHLTLRFIGEVDELVFRDVLDSLDDVRSEPFPLVLRGVGHFPPRGEPRVLWVGVEKSAPLFELQRRVERAVARAGVAPDGRKFSPHVTLARLNGSPSRAVGSFIATHSLFASEPVSVREFHLYSSALSSKRAQHSCEASFELRP